MSENKKINPSSLIGSVNLPNSMLSYFQRQYLNKEPRIEFFLGNDKKHWWRLSFSSDIVCASSQGYETEALAKENFLKVEKHIEWLRINKKV